MMKPPCKNCPKRQIGCHSDCPEYLEYRGKLAEEREIEKLNRIRTFSARKSYRPRSCDFGKNSNLKDS